MEETTQENLTEEHRKIQSDVSDSDLNAADAGLTFVRGMTPRFSSFTEFMKSTKAAPGFGRVPSEPVPKTLKELFQNYSLINSELLSQEAEVKKAGQLLASLNDQLREVASKIRVAKDSKNKALDLADDKRLSEINIELEMLNHKLLRLEAQIPPLAEQHRKALESVNKLKERLIFPRRFLLRAIGEDLKTKILDKCRDEIQTLAAINTEVIGSVRLSKIFADVEIAITGDNAMQIVNSTIDFYAKEFQKEGSRDKAK